ncbi:sugar kinase [Pandoraea thiooxydans]|uniref:Bifunctional NAD(P)H-hydrate repair enzyme n=1 Tax=Pandoraea thiooxydans TaxID=445709 RepID=A0A0G3ERF6_9BURK|nr:NAD(P)H-hydrate dehydratase [Pandoraea thiooxydans]AKJ67877.1 NAD(P)H-hydrate dehydratase [Pandoraea thiooxydans]APR95072.1 sugar kinase [Pandoraea thiooxydans]
MLKQPFLPLYDVARLRRIEQRAQAHLAPHTLMAHAGRAAANWLYGELARTPADARPILILAGHGNNGGDALVLSAELARRGVPVQVWLLAKPSTDDARWALAEAQAAGVPISPVPASLPGHADGGFPYHWGVDGLFGIGLSRPLDEPTGALVAWFNAQPFRRLALDVPSGLLADVGQPAGRREHVVRADATIAFLGATAGLYTGVGRDCAGVISIDTLGVSVDASSTANGEAPRAWLNTPGLFAAHLPRRQHASHKGTYGALAVLGGNQGMLGAPILAARAALHLGAGRVHVGFVAPDFPPYDSLQPELMLRHAHAVERAEMQALATGPGMGRDAGALACLADALDHPDISLVLDADALNLLSAHAEFGERLRRRAVPAVLTPHPLEAARLLGCDAAAVQADRLGAARDLAQRYGAVAVLKGSGTVIDDGEYTLVNPTGNAGLASAGSGDVLTGMIGALLAQGMPPLSAAAVGVYLHGRAAERLVDGGQGPAGLTAGELPGAARDEFNGWLQTT